MPETTITLTADELKALTEAVEVEIDYCKAQVKSCLSTPQEIEEWGSQLSLMQAVSHKLGRGN